MPTPPTALATNDEYLYPGPLTGTGGDLEYGDTNGRLRHRGPGPRRHLHG